MSLLLDTHVLLWWASDDPRLGVRTRRSLLEQEVAVSAVSGWEIEVKRARGRLDAPDDLVELLAEQGFTASSLTLRHAVDAGRLPRHHDDPFDRALVAQARAEGLRLVSADRALAAYDVSRLDPTR